MTEAHRRKKQPGMLRQQLLDSTSGIVVEQGVQAVTLDAVARRAGVSKGGLQHHFPSKQALLDALFLDSVERFRDDLSAQAQDDPEEHGRAARAYLRVLARQPSEDGDLLRALIAVMLTDPDPRSRWGALYKEFAGPDPGPDPDAAKLMICRLAADGLWISELLGYQGMTRTLKAEVLRQLEQMTRG